jgi:hypothetical protein
VYIKELLSIRKPAGEGEAQCTSISICSLTKIINRSSDGVFPGCTSPADPGQDTTLFVANMNQSEYIYPQSLERLEMACIKYVLSGQLAVITEKILINNLKGQQKEVLKVYKR